MPPITRTRKSPVDTDGDQTPDVIFSVIPEEPAQVQHAQDASYRVQVHNLRPGVDLRFRIRQFDVHGDEYYVESPVVIPPGELRTLETVSFHDEGPPHPNANPERIQRHVKYMIMIGAERGRPVDFAIEAHCLDQPGGTGALPPSGEGTEGHFVIHLGHLRVKVGLPHIAIAKEGSQDANA